jgi:hypothetical protein
VRTHPTPAPARARRAFVAAAAAAGLACASAPPRIVIPAGEGVPEPQALTYWWDATNACRTVQSFSAELTVNGRIGREKLRRVTLQGGMTRQGGIRLVAVAPVGAPVFVLAGQTANATLALPRDRRVLTAPAADIVEALIGLRLTPSDWMDVLTGCVSAEKPGPGVRVGDAIVLLGEGGRRVMIRQDAARWRVVAGERGDAQVAYPAFSGTWPSSVHVTSAGNRASAAGVSIAIDLTMTIGQIFANTDLPAATFDPPASDGFAPMTLGELRAIGPLGEANRPGGVNY